MYKIYPSSFTPIQGVTTNPTYKEGCLRFLLARTVLPRGPDIDPIFQTIGLLAEERINTLLEGTFYDREVPVSIDLGDNVRISGRADFVTSTCVIESKATLSTAKRAQWRRGEFSLEHLGQLVTYMSALNRPIGYLRCTYVHFSKDVEWLGFEEFSWHVRVSETGEIYIEGTLFPALSAADIGLFYATVKNALVGDKLPPRPTTDKPCQTCPLAKICAGSAQDRSEYLREVEQLIDAGIEPVGGFKPSIKVHDRRGTKYE